MNDQVRVGAKPDQPVSQPILVQAVSIVIKEKKKAEKKRRNKGGKERTIQPTYEAFFRSC